MTSSRRLCGAGRPIRGWRCNIEVASTNSSPIVMAKSDLIQRHVTGTPFRDDEFAQVVRGGASDQGVALQYRGGIDELFTNRDGEVRSDTAPRNRNALSR